MSATTRFKFIRRQQGVFLACLLPFCAGALSAATNACYTTARALQEALDDNTPRSGDFRLEGTVITPTADIDTFLFTDGTGFLRMTDGCFWPRRPFVAGDRVRLGGRIVRQDPAPYNYPKAFTIEILGHGPAPEPVDISAEDLYAGTCLNRIVRIRGTILDAQPDDINPRYVFLVVDAGDGLVYVPCLDPKFKDTYESLVGSRVELTGAVQRQLPDDTGRMIPLVVIMLTDTLRVLAPAVQEPHTIDTANDRYKAIAPILAGQPPLIRLRGTVLAAGQGHTILLRNQDGSVSTVSPISTAHPPPGTVIEAIGTAETDFYHLNLSRARWRKVSDVAQPPEPAERIDPGQIMSDTDGRLLAKSSYHGHTVRITGTVLSMPSLGNGRLMLDCRGMSVPVEVSTTPEVLDDLAVGCQLDVSGVCMLEIDNWRPQLPFPRIRGFIIIPRTPADIRILSHPPWWTVRKLLFVVAGLVLVIAGLVLRNLLARRLANIKLGERTRLAVELHDTIAQNLTGAAFEVNTAEQLARVCTDASLEHLDRASRTLKSCRDELRNCIWDLRGKALEEPHLADAIRMTLEPHIEDVQLGIRVTVPRSRFADNAAHALLRILRELTLNAIRHGHATSIRIAGAISGEKALFSVSDNGTGFEVDSAPGIRQGHYGLQGVRERVRELKGTVVWTSSPGKGTKVKLTL